MIPDLETAIQFAHDLRDQSGEDVVVFYHTVAGLYEICCTKMFSQILKHHENIQYICTIMKI